MWNRCAKNPKVVSLQVLKTTSSTTDTFCAFYLGNNRGRFPPTTENTKKTHLLLKKTPQNNNQQTNTIDLKAHFTQIFSWQVFHQESRQSFTRNKEFCHQQPSQYWNQKCNADQYLLGSAPLHCLFYACSIK